MQATHGHVDISLSVAVGNAVGNAIGTVDIGHIHLYAHQVGLVVERKSFYIGLRFPLHRRR